MDELIEALGQLNSLNEGLQATIEDHVKTIDALSAVVLEEQAKVELIGNGALKYKKELDTLRERIEQSINLLSGKENSSNYVYIPEDNIPF